MTKAMISEFVVPESSEEKRLWKDRALLEVRVERKEKMLGNTQARLKTEWSLQGRQELEDEANELKREINELRGEISIVDREIRAVEKDGSNELEDAKLRDMARALGEAKERMESEVRIVSDLEGKLREAGRL